ncbi:family 16 glycosylhydrolase [Vibrio sp. FNV 38]|nr:family 16 glycosylhydrolase [Vibrio sp. FNV 38]
MTISLSSKRNLVTLLMSVSCFFANTTFAADAPMPHTAKAGEKWVLQQDRSDEFNFEDTKKWDFQPNPFQIWTWEKDNAIVEDGKLKLTASYEKHNRKFEDGCNEKTIYDFPLFFKSGMIKSKSSGVYGYYEAKIKGTDLHPGVSPAFWVYSNIDTALKNEGDIQYAEIDIVELLQDEEDPTHSDHNLHNIIVKDGKPQWVRPKPNAETHQNLHNLGFDPREEFAIYAVDVTPEDITWYVNGEQVGYKKNLYWHKEMNVALSLGMRGEKFTRWDCNQFYPVDVSAEDSGLPTTMEVQYVRVWNKE